MQMSGFAVGFGLGASTLRPGLQSPGGGAADITATLPPALSPLTDTQTPAEGYAPGVYASSAGTIVSQAETYLVNGVAQPAGHDLAAGDSVQVSVLVTDSAGNSAVFVTGTVAVSAAGTGAAIAINVTRGADQVAPDAIFFEASPSGFAAGAAGAGEVYAPEDHDIHYTWSFSDPGTYGAPVNLVAGLNDRNKAYGRKVWHCFTQPGTYTVSVTAVDRAGNSATASTDVTVGDPAVAWSGSATLCVALDGDFTGAPSGAVQYTTLSAAFAAYGSLPGKGRLLLKRGETYTITSRIDVDGSYSNFHLGAWGAGNRPVLDNIADGIGTLRTKGGYSGDLTISDIVFQGGWDATTETGLEGQWAIFIYSPARVTVSQCDFDGHDTSIYPHTDTAALCVHDCAITNWENYGIFAGKAQGAKAAILGTRIAQHVDALAGSTSKAVPANWHGPLRHGFKSLYMDCCDLFSNNGWSTNPGAVFAAQPCIRHNSKVTPDIYAYYTRTVCEGGWKIISMQDASGAKNDLAGNCIWDGCYFLGTASTDYAMYIQYGGTTVRNCVVVRPDVPALVNGFQAMIYLDTDGLDAVNTASPVDIYNNTFIDLRSAANDTNDPFRIVTNVNGYFSNITEENNISHAPNLPGAIIGDVPLSTAPVFSPRYKGFRWSGAPVLDTAYATPAGAVADYRPLAGSAAIGDATTGQTAYDDFFGAVRATPRSRGAIEGG